MKKISTVAIERMQIFKEHQRTSGLDLGGRTSHYCILNEAGEVIWQALRSDNAKRNPRRSSIGFRAVGVGRTDCFLLFQRYYLLSKTFRSIVGKMDIAYESLPFRLASSLKAMPQQSNTS